ncbi:sensor domain-containing diguanylate cyclase [Serratia fonticola]|uniref:sensor domain-containing diguanylate cyclase n=1 Tax=Serratia fonticola TaxID=47917 RepID=UPI002DB9D053|nr:EAL domain-containing protein [Serratia fonticola]MEB7885363.1 EAL domain-containing protein [Serratia fonticola]
MLRHLSKNEEERQASIDALEGLETSHNDVIHNVLDLTCRLLQVPGCFIYLYGSKKIWIKAQINTELRDIDFNSPLFNFVRLCGKPLICQDTQQDKRFASDPMVTGPAAIRHYIAMPLRTREGYIIGALCITGRQPREFSTVMAGLLNNTATIVIELIEAQSEIGLVDAVTRFPNRQRLMGEIGNLSSAPGEYALILLDTIDIKYAYEMARSFGLSAVELVLVDIGHFLKDTFLGEQILYSISLGRFATIIDAKKIRSAIGMLETCAERIRHEVRGIVPLKLELYAGYTLFSVQDSNPQEVLREATSALHDAIDESVTVSAYSVSKDAIRKHKFNLLNELAESLKQRVGLYLEYQPKVELISKQIVGAEALLRWQHPVLGVIPAGDFIHLAENTSLIKSLTEFVISQAVSDVFRLRQAGFYIPISINVTTENFAEKNFSDRLNAALADYNLQPEDIELECLESQRIFENSDALACLQMLQGRGYTIALDDFGAGYSNLNYLRHIPANVIKLDRSLIKNLRTDNESRIVVQSITDMLHKLNYVVLAEGVEDQESLHYLEQYGCDIAQGFYFSPSVSLEKFCILLKVGRF